MDRNLLFGNERYPMRRMAWAITPAIVAVLLWLAGPLEAGSKETFVSLTGGSVAWQIGATSTDVILVYRSRQSVEGIMKGKFTLGVDAAVAAGPVGRSAEAATDIQRKAEIYSYSRSRGLFAGVSVAGAALQIDDANADYYGREGVRPREILKGKEFPHPRMRSG
jgi:lipid-binding SYLF domain-containing protein